jgi:hypothetical protein
MKKFAFLAIIPVAAALAVLAVLPGCATAPTSQYTEVDGVGIWKGAAPSQPYTVIDTVRRDGPDTSVTYADLERSIVDEAKRRGATGVIIQSEVMAVSQTSLLTGRQIMAPKVTAELISGGN